MCGRDWGDKEYLCGSDDGDGQIGERNLKELAYTERTVYERQLRSSGQNELAEKWSIGVGNYAASTSLAAGDYTFGAGLLKAMLTVSQDKRPTILVAVDYPFPDPLNATRPIGAPFGVALVLTPDHDTGLGPCLEVTYSQAQDATPPRNDDVRTLWKDCPPAKAIPLLEGFITPTRIVVEAGSGYFLDVEVS